MIKTPEVILIDGNSLAYRAFYALPETLKTSYGLQTNAVYGFTTMLLKALEEKPRFVAVAFDRPEPTFRHKTFKEYKATRDKAPSPLIEQLPYIREILDGLNIPVFELPGYEADDVIGTLAKKAEKDGFRVVILSGDLDPLQLVNKNIEVITTRRGITDTVTYDEKKIAERFTGLKPHQLVDFKSLKGDSSDNIPGVSGIGEKTAINLLNEFTSLENLYKNVSKVKSEKTKKKLLENKETAELSKNLARIVTDLPIEINFGSPVVISWEKAAKLFKKLEFTRLVEKYSEGAEIKEEKEILEAKWDLISNKDEFSKMNKILEKADFFSFQVVEEKGKIFGVSFSTDKHSFYLPFDTKEILPLVKELFSSKKLKIGHNVKESIHLLRNLGMDLEIPYFDTMIAAYLLDPGMGKYEIKRIVKFYLNKDVELKKTAEAELLKDLSIERAGEYFSSIALGIARLYIILLEKIKEKELESLTFDVEIPLIKVLAHLEANGVYIDTKKLGKLSKQISSQLAELEKDIYCIAGEKFNINSPKQLQYILFEKLKLPKGKRTKTGLSTDAEVLEELASKFEIAEKLLEYRQLIKLKSTYIDALPELINPETHRIHASFDQTGTQTGRLSSFNPNLQNIPIRSALGREIRDAFSAQKKDWLILTADYSQIELRILAHLSKDKELINAFIQGKDIHRTTAAQVFDVSEGLVADDMRSAAKAVNFGIIYGISEFGLAKQLKIKKKEAAAFISKYFEKYKQVKEFIDQIVEKARKDEYVKTILGRRRDLPNINSANRTLSSLAERMAINSVIQGTAADMIKVAMIKIHSEFEQKKLKAKLILQVHDELVYELPKNELEEVRKIVADNMINALPLDVPVIVDVSAGDSWGEAK